MIARHPALAPAVLAVLLALPTPGPPPRSRPRRPTPRPPSGGLSFFPRRPSSRALAPAPGLSAAPVLVPALSAAPAAAVAAAVAASPDNADPRRLALLETIGRPWDPANLGVTRLPVSVGRLEDGAAFSAPAPPGAKAQSMAIKRPGTDVRLPAELAQFREAVARVVAFEKAINPFFDVSHLYLTFSQGEVEPGDTQRRPNAHTDGWPRDAAGAARPVDRAYLVSDALPTEFFDQPFAAPERSGFADVHDALERQTDPARVVTHAPYEIVMLDGYTVHRSPIATARVRRTFLKLHFSTADFGMAKNTPNPLFADAAAPAALAAEPPLATGGSVPMRERLAEEWSDYAARRAAAPAGGAVSDPVGLFAALFNVGKLWWSTTRWGPRVSSVALAAPARRAAGFFAAAPQTRAAADAFVARALDAGTGDSANQRRKLLRETFLAASVLAPAAAAALFHARGFPRGPGPAERRARGEEILARFKTAVEKIVAHRLALDPSFNVVGAVVAGSYVDGTARDGSEILLDFVALTRDGSTRGVRDFLQELAAAAPAEGWPPSPDWKRYANVISADAAARAFTAERPSRIYSPLPDVRALAHVGPTLEQGRPLDAALYRLTAPFFRLWVAARLWLAP